MSHNKSIAILHTLGEYRVSRVGIDDHSAEQLQTQTNYPAKRPCVNAEQLKLYFGFSNTFHDLQSALEAAWN